jgi:PAS domain S-box-containing protein
VSLVEGAAVRRVYVSEAAARILGYPAEELIGNSTFLSFQPEEAKRLQAMSQQWRRGQSVPFFLESVVRHKDGTLVPVEVAYSEVRLDGKPATVAFLRDIRERKRTEVALQKSEALFRKLIEAAPEAVMVARDNHIVYVNPRYLQLLGYDNFEELGAKSVIELIHPDDRISLDARQQCIHDLAFPPPREYRLLRRDGSAVCVECSSLSIDFEGTPAILTFARDITERKETQAQLIQTDRMVTIGTLAAGVAHELNNPLAYVLLNLGILERELDELLEDASDRERVKARLHTVQEGAERMATIVRDLRSFCRPNSPTPRPVDVRQVLESAINMAMNELRDRARLVRDYSPIPEVVADGARLGQVFLNLLLNAAQALGEGRPIDNEVRVVLRSDGDRVRIEIADSGHGIEPEILGRIFEPFFTTKPAGIGTGLGLSICQSIVANMQGELTVVSQVGRGATFRVSLPAHRAESEEEAPRKPEVIAVAKQPARPARILIVDDESAIAAALKKILDAEHEVTAVTTGKQALELLLNGTSFDVILCDVLMPGVSGIDLYRVLEERRPELKGRIIFMSGASSMPRVAEFFSSVQNGKIDKPVDVPHLCELIREVDRR